MTETSYFWTGASVGDAGPYTDIQFAEIFRSLFTTNPGLQGVLTGYADELAVVNLSGNTISVASGGAVVGGRIYVNTAPLDAVIDTPSAGNSRIDLVVLRSDFTLQTVRKTILTGSENVSPITPTFIQDDVTWEIPLASIYITDAGVIAVTDLRQYTRFATPMIHLRQGGSIADWNAPGEINFRPSLAGIQAGAVLISLVDDDAAINVVTFPEAFVNIPIVLVTCNNSNYIAVSLGASTTETTLAIKHRLDALATIDVAINWLAVGELS